MQWLSAQICEKSRDFCTLRRHWVRTEVAKAHKPRLRVVRVLWVKQKGKLLTKNYALANYLRVLADFRDFAVDTYLDPAIFFLYLPRRMNHGMKNVVVFSGGSNATLVKGSK